MVRDIDVERRLDRGERPRQERSRTVRIHGNEWPDLPRLAAVAAEDEALAFHHPRGLRQPPVQGPQDFLAAGPERLAVELEDRFPVGFAERARLALGCMRRF